ncbi:SCO6880 family protein [Alloscardovia venturai]|uniref:SCO6880 family protein n=1 Tax=Alloscardovia venturai TaxID=1769421 RepID=A0ABW2Y785_9BIFI
MSAKTTHRFTATFSPVSNTGVLLWLQKHQVIIIGGIVSYMMLILLIGAPLWTPPHIILMGIAGLSAVTIKGRSLIQLAAIRLGFALRSVTGQTRWTLNPLSQDEIVGLIDLPGAAGQRLKPLEVVNTQFKGASFLYDKENSQATAILRCMGKPFVFTSTDTQDERARQFSHMLSQLSEYPDIVRLTIQSRSLMTPFHVEIADNNEFAADEIRDMVAENMRVIMSHDMIISLTVSQDKAKNLVKNYGGGVAGISGLLKDRLIPLVNMLEQAGIDSQAGIVWENTAQIRAMMKLMSDATAYGTINERLELDDDVPVASNYREYMDYVHVGDTYARTLWVDKWPSDPATVGFLHQLTSVRDAQIVFTQAFKPKPENKARRALNARKDELERIKRLNKNMGRNDDPRLILEDDEVDKRLTELVVHKAEVDFQGFVTILAPSKLLLDETTRNIITSMTFMHFDRMHGQQYAAWVSALPLGQAGR